MKYSYNWLKKLSGTKKSPEQLAEFLTARAFEVEGIEKIGKRMDKVVAGKILEIKKHPNADKLRIAKIDIGAKKLDIVCGAPNIAVGNIAPVALPGAILSGGMVIREADIRGVKSSGMLCAEDELGLGSDRSGILILEKNARPGIPVSRLLNLDDAIIEIGVLSNRGHDAASHVGMAREICALEGRKLKYNFSGLSVSGKKTLRAEIEDRNLCPRYIGAVMENIQIKESPQWMQSTLKKLGFKPINNVVDATNYVMLELGQPTHAFDFDKIKSAEIANIKFQNSRKTQKKLIIRPAKNGEEIKLLDENIKKLTQNDLVIADNEQPVAIAGVMGGLDSGITQNTRKIILESANFNSTSVRQTRLRHNLPTDAVLRFEKKLDPNLAESAMARLVELLSEGGGRVADVVDNYPKKIKSWKIILDTEYVGRLLGKKIETKTIKNILESFELKIGKNVSKKRGKIVVEIPTFRLDLKTQEDLIEEVGRVYGYEKIKPSAPLVFLETPPVNEARLFEKEVKKIIFAAGYSEVYNYSFYGKREANLAQIDKIEHLEIDNPINPELALLRVSLVPNLLKNIRENLKYFDDVRIFEIGRTYHPRHSGLPEEKLILAGVLVLKTRENKSGKTEKAPEFYEIKGRVDAVLGRLGIFNHYYDNFNANSADPFGFLWHRERGAEIKIEGRNEIIGRVGEINPLFLARFDIHRRVAMFEFEMERLRSVSEGEREYHPIRKYPAVTRDISMISKSGARVDDILRSIQEAGGDLVLDVDLFDIYDFADGTSSFAFRIIFGADDRTLEGEEVDELMKKISAKLEKELRMEIRR